MRSRTSLFAKKRQPTAEEMNTAMAAENHFATEKLSPLSIDEDGHLFQEDVIENGFLLPLRYSSLLRSAVFSLQIGPCDSALSTAGLPQAKFNGKCVWS